MGVSTTVIPSQIDIESTDNDTINVNASNQIQINPTWDASDIKLPDALQEIEIMELQANNSMSPADYDTMVTELFKGSSVPSTGFNGYVDTGTTTATFNTNAGYQALDYIDQFQRPNFGGGWGGSWSPLPGASCIPSVTSNRGRFTRSGNTSARTLYTLGNQASAWDYQATFRLNDSSGASEGVFAYFGVNIASNTNPSASGMCVFYNSDTGVLSLLREGSVIATDGGAIGQLTDDTDYKVRLAWNATNLRVRIWLASTSEPGTWNLDTACATTSGTEMGFQMDGTTNGTGTNDWTNIVSSDAGWGADTFYVIDLANLPTISGTVTHTMLVLKGSADAFFNIQYTIEDASANQDTVLNENTKNALVNLTSNPTRLIVRMNKGGSTDLQNTRIEGVTLVLWKS